MCRALLTLSWFFFLAEHPTRSSQHRVANHDNSTGCVCVCEGLVHSTPACCSKSNSNVEDASHEGKCIGEMQLQLYTSWSYSVHLQSSDYLLPFVNGHWEQIPKDQKEAVGLDSAHVKINVCTVTLCVGVALVFLCKSLQPTPLLLSFIALSSVPLIKRWQLENNSKKSAFPQLIFAEKSKATGRTAVRRWKTTCDSSQPVDKVSVSCFFFRFAEFLLRD